MSGNCAGIIAGFLLFMAPMLAVAETDVAENTEPDERVVRVVNEQLIGTFDIETTIPEAPGFSIVDANPTNVLDPGAAPITFASFTNFLDEDNNLKPGFALGGTPYWWLNRNKELQDYRSNAKLLERWAANTSISIAFAEGGESSFDRIGVGVSVNLIGGDYRRDEDLYACVGTVIREISAATRPDKATVEGSDVTILEAIILPQATREVNGSQPDETPREVAIIDRATELSKEWQAKQILLYYTENKPDLDKRLAKCKGELEKRFSSRASWTVAAAAPIELEDEDGSNINVNGGSLWSSYRMPIANAPFGLAGSDDAPGYLSLFGKYDFDRTQMVDGVTDEMMSAMPEQQEALSVNYDAGILGLLYGIENSQFKASLQFGWETIEYADNEFGLKDDDYTFYALSVDRKLRDGVWLKLQIGSTEKRAALDSGENEYFKLSFSYDFFN
jgi:hypothetical protein